MGGCGFQPQTPTALPNISKLVMYNMLGWIQQIPPNTEMDVWECRTKDAQTQIHYRTHGLTCANRWDIDLLIDYYTK